MSEPKFTPGPWFINDWPQANTDITIGGAGIPLIAKVPLRDVSINGQKANAHLIAAAPELYAALDAIMEYPGNNLMAVDITNAAKAALRKARGEAP